MELLPPVVHCLVDQEPTSFHNNDVDKKTFSFAVNLSFEARAPNATNDQEELKKEEAAAQKQFEDFLTDVANVAFHLFSVDEIDPTKLELTYVVPVDRIPTPTPAGDPNDLIVWLKEQRSQSPRNVDRYWSTVAGGWAPEDAIDADTATASDRLRAVQSWNAPIGHRFSLTHIVRIPRDKITSPRFVVLPYFGKVKNPPPPLLDRAHDYPPTDPNDIVKSALDYAYKPLSKFDKIVCRTNLIGEGITKPFEPHTVDEGLNADGYFIVDKNAETVRRLLVWFEERAASLLGANTALASRARDPNNDPAFEDLFGIKAVDIKDKDGNVVDTKFYWGSIVWYVTARLISTLDNLVIAFLKPIASKDGKPAFDGASEGEMLAPLVSQLRERIDSDLAEKFGLSAFTLDSAKIAGAVRSAIAGASPLVAVPQQSSASVVRALRRVFAIEPLQAKAPRNAREFVSAILARYGDSADGIELPADYKDYAKTLDGKSVVTVTRALLDFEQPLLGETGAETAIVRLVEDARDGGPSIARLVAMAYLAAIKRPGEAALQAAVEDAFNRAWIAYRGLLDGDFNGAEAVRRAAGSSFTRALLDYAKPDGVTDTPTRVINSATRSSFCSRRLLGRRKASKSFDPQIAPLVCPDPETILLTGEKADLPPNKYRRRYLRTVAQIRKHLEAAFADAIGPIRSLNDPSARFIPDSTPQPLAIQIAATIDGSKFDEFEKHFNGIAVVIEREDKGADPDQWAHAHLADLRWDRPAKPSDLAPAWQSAMAALHPMLPAISDGRGPMFIEYHGFPFADPALDARVVDSEGAPRDPRRPFYRQETHDQDELPKFAPVPRLAYGRMFRTFSFITSNAGTLPLALQELATSPWMPNAKIAEPDKDSIGVVTYQRRTAIAQMAVIEPDTRPRRIGAMIDGVMPLAADYPRVGLEAHSSASGTRDILREADGRGVMAATQNAEWRISGMAFSGEPSSMTVRFFDRPAMGPEDPGTEFVIDEKSVPGFAEATEITISVEFISTAGPTECWLTVACGTTNGTTTLPAQRLTDRSALAGWLRLVLASKSSATLTFAAPATQQADNVPAPLLLLAPAGDPWRADLAREITATVSTPRVSYLDFERWFANADLYHDTFGADPKPGAPGSALMSALLTAYLMRHFDPNLAKAIDQLPDPAVECVRLELTALDNLSANATKAVEAVQLELGSTLTTFAAGITEPTKGWTPARLLALVLGPLDELFKFRIRPMAGSPLRLAQPNKTVPLFEAAVPPGVTARLSLDALVPARFFEDNKVEDNKGCHPPVMYKGLKQYALRDVSGRLAFPAAALRVETMYDDDKLFAAPLDENDEIAPPYNEVAIKLGLRMISVEGVERTRRFSLTTASAVPKVSSDKPADLERLTRQWRLIGEIEVTTQRWRPTGRPIYHYVNPRAFRHDGAKREAPVAHPALRLTLGDVSGEIAGDDPLAQFEREAFFDRPDIDSSTVTQRLDPLPARTQLREHHWDSSSATYFRHRFTLRSRYAGALTQRHDVASWPKNTKQGREAESAPYAWTVRVVMLAELARILLTRPQLRALIPLTTTPGGDEKNRPAPPIAAVLQEPPFARGGLADRIAAEAKTGFGYGFKDDSKHVEILDSRKEGGPNPHLDYRPLRHEAALGLLLRSEGPMGLTFDSINAPAPALPNCTFSLKPDTLPGNAPLPEEFFAGVAMRRYIDPDWTTGAGEPAHSLDGEGCWWITRQDYEDGVQDLLSYTVGGATRKLLTLDKSACIEVRASKLAIDGVGATEGEKDDPVPVMRIAAESFAGLAVLHQVVAPGRYSASVFVATHSTSVERGEINVPAMLASFEWSPPEAREKPNDPDRKPPIVTLTVPAGTAHPTMASAPTFLRWTHTGRDFDFLYTAKPAGDEWRFERCHVREVVAALDPKHHRLTFARAGTEETIWLCPSTFTNPQPLHVHRHLGVVTSYFLKEFGRPVELFDRSAALRENGAMLVAPDGSSNGKDIYQPRDHVARVVEFETPAQILCGSPVPVPEKYKTAYFDLVSTGFMKKPDKDAPSDASIHFHLRFVGPPAQLRQFARLTVALRNATPKKPQDSAPPPDDTMTLSFDLKNTAKIFSVGAQISLRQAARKPGETIKPVVTKVLLLRSSGLLEDAAPKIEKPLTLEKADNNRPGLFVSVNAKSPGGEFWTDVSLLHSANIDQDIALDFDWLFAPGNGTEPVASVSPPGLAAMTEAQARVIAVSPPIPIVKH